MKLLIIRFSSIGDLTQALSIPSLVKSQCPDSEIHFVTRKDLASLLQNHPHIEKIWTADKVQGLSGLLELIRELKKENFTHIYDAHNNLRSFILRLFLWKPKKLVRPMNRMKRFLLLRFHYNLFEKPFSGQRDLLKPLEKWGLHFELPPAPQIFLSPELIQYQNSILKKNNLSEYIVLVPSAAYELKRWPIDFWKKLIDLNPHQKFVILAGENDDFTSALNQNPHVLNLTGKTNLLESAALIQKASVVVSNDTGLLHISEQLGRPTIALMGPAPFGFPSRSSTLILERLLTCRPCSKHGQGPCVNPIYQLCLRDISADEVSQKMNQLR